MQWIYISSQVDLCLMIKTSRKKNDFIRKILHKSDNTNIFARWKKCFTFWEGAWILQNFCQKNLVFSWVHRKCGIIRQDTVIILTFTDEKYLFSWILSYIWIICSQNIEYIHISQKNSATFNSFWEAPSHLP